LGLNRSMKKLKVQISEGYLYDQKNITL
jgi:hypothetical protein